MVELLDSYKTYKYQVDFKQFNTIDTFLAWHTLDIPKPTLKREEREPSVFDHLIFCAITEKDEWVENEYIIYTTSWNSHEGYNFWLTKVGK